MATHSSTLAWKTPWTEGGLQWGSQRVEHDGVIEHTHSARMMLCSVEGIDAQ